MQDAGESVPQMLISVGSDDDFLNEQLHIGSLPTTNNVTVKLEDGYDHSYYFISTFIEEHVRWHAKALF
jgi:S-formylglutathione hydrolase